MEKKKMAKVLMLTAALAGGMTAAGSFTNEVQASGCYNFKVEYEFYNGGPHSVCKVAGDNCRYVPR